MKKQAIVRTLSYTWIFWILQGSVTAQPVSGGLLRTGDLLFQNLDCGDICTAIEAVTRGWQGHSFSHVGVVERVADSLYVWESMGPGVRRVRLDSFRSRSGHPLVWGRLKKRYQPLIPAAMAFLHESDQLPYDEVFLFDNGKYYCAELIYEAFKQARGGRALFRLYPMTFKQPGSDVYFPVWDRYYRRLGVPVPEGQPGCNPGGLSRSRKLVIKGAF